MAATKAKNNDKPNTLGIFLLFKSDSVNPNARIQALPNNGPYQIPPTKKEEIEATITDNQLMFAKADPISIVYCFVVLYNTNGISNPEIVKN
tara:strand:- start:942 stop:1217 length:276 start_codon:yes stop_codon:yes gene_type:complete